MIQLNDTLFLMPSSINSQYAWITMADGLGRLSNEMLVTGRRIAVARGYIIMRHEAAVLTPLGQALLNLTQ